MPISGELRCRICGGRLESSFEAREMYSGSREGFGYSTCTICRCLQIDEIPSDLGRFYANGYFTQRAKPVSGMNERKASSIRRGWTAARLAAGPLLRPLAGRRYGRFDWFTRTQTRIDDAILDVGCGSGRLLWHLHREGFRDLTGIDPHLGRWTSGEHGPRFIAEALEDHEGQYHCVMSHHSFEHVADPPRAFGAFARLVAPEGWLLLRIPVADSWAREHYGRDWVQLDAPRHLHLHTRASIDRLASDFGFRVREVVDDSGAFQVWGSELYRRDVALSEAEKYGRPHLGWGHRLRAELQAARLRRRSLGDQACFYLEHGPKP